LTFGTSFENTGHTITQRYLYNVKLYGTDVRFRRPDLEELRVQLINQYSPYFMMLKRVNPIIDEELMQQIIKLIDDYESTQQKRVKLCDTNCL
jgi:hypothetical protein